MAGALHQLNFFAQLIGIGSKLLIQFRAVDARDDRGLLRYVVFSGLVQVDLVIQQVVDALEALSHADGPGNRCTLDAQYRFNFIQQFQRVAAFPVQFVDEGENGCLPHAADFHQADGALFHALGAVDDHQGRVHRC